MEVRHATKDDLGLLPAVERSAAAVFRATAMEWVIGLPTLDCVKLERALAGGTLWVAAEKDSIAGFLCAHRMERLLFIDELSVHADFQRHGIGRALMKRALGEVRKGLDGAALTTDRELPWNAPFYASLGFEELDDPPPAIAAELADEEADGFDMTRRCAMMLRFG